MASMRTMLSFGSGPSFAQHPHAGAAWVLPRHSTLRHNGHSNYTFAVWLIYTNEKIPVRTISAVYRSNAGRHLGEYRSVPVGEDDTRIRETHSDGVLNHQRKILCDDQLPRPLGL